MARFFFHRQQNGKLIEDHTGRRFADEKAACRYAFRRAATAIGRIKNPSDTYVGIEVTDGSRTCCIVRASIVLEKPKWVGSARP
jgi:hypothetical protein